MFTPPTPPPSWDAYHPILVHFPIALLLAAPVLFVLALILQRHRNPLNLAGVVIMALGCVGLFLAFSSGHAAEEWVDEAGPVGAVLEQHEDAAALARILFPLFTLFFAAYTFVPWMKQKEPRRAVAAVVGVLLLALYAVPCLVLMNASHLGGRLVHEFGVHARFTASGQPSAAPAHGERDDD